MINQLFESGQTIFQLYALAKCLIHLLISHRALHTHRVLTLHFKARVHQTVR